MNALRDIRKALNLTQVQAAEILGVTQSAVSKMDGKLPAVVIEKLASHCGYEAYLKIGDVEFRL